MCFIFHFHLNRKIQEFGCFSTSFHFRWTHTRTRHDTRLRIYFVSKYTLSVSILFCCCCCCFGCFDRFWSPVDTRSFLYICYVLTVHTFCIFFFLVTSSSFFFCDKNHQKNYRNAYTVWCCCCCCSVESPRACVFFYTLHDIWLSRHKTRRCI